MKIIDNNLYADAGHWLYTDYGEDRLFFKSITLAKIENKDLYFECADAEKEAWEAAHNAGIEDAEIVE